MNKITKIFKGQIKGIDETNYTVNAIISDETLDRFDEIILASAWKKRLGAFKAHPILLSSHNYRGLTNQIGELPEIKVTEEGLEAKIKYYVNEGNPEADWAFNLAKKGMAAFSVGFISHASERDPEKIDELLKDKKIPKGKKVYRVYTDIELLENSQVTVPANPSALQKGLEVENDPIVKDLIGQVQAFDKEELSKFDYENKGVVPFKEYSLIDKDTSWNGGEAKKRLRTWAGGDNIDWKKYRKGFLWYDDTNAELLGSYKAPHHDIVGGEIKTHWRGTVAAMVVLLGGRGGLNIPDNDRKPAYNHLAKHYKSFDEKAPDFKQYDNIKDVISGCHDIITASMMVEVIYEERMTKAFINILENLALENNLEAKIDTLTNNIVNTVKTSIELYLDEIKFMLRKKGETNSKEKSYIETILETTASLKKSSV